MLGSPPRPTVRVLLDPAFDICPLPDATGGQLGVRDGEVVNRLHDLVHALTGDTHQVGNLGDANEVMSHAATVRHELPTDNDCRRITPNVNRWPRRCVNTPGPGRNLLGRPDMGSVHKATDTTVSETTSYVCATLADGRLAPISLIRNSDLIQGFAAFLARSRVEITAEITPELASAYVHSFTRSGGEPSVATMRLRRSALRLLFREAKSLGLIAMDPSADIALPSRTYGRSRPLTDAEIEKCRSFAEGMRGDARYAIAWTLAEATARIPELAGIARHDVSVESVALPGCSMTDSRVVQLTGWGVEQVERLKLAAERRADGPAVRTGSNGSPHELVAATLRRAGLAKKPGVSPNSVPAWRGATELAGGASIDEVTKLLGMRSLDRAAAFIGFDWRADA